jgi:hypothetical protein
MPAPWPRAPHLFVALTALSVGACKATLESTPGARNELAGDIGITARDEVEAGINALTVATSLTPLDSAQSPTAFDAPCVAPSSPGDSDGDGVPDDATYLLTAPPCRFTGWRGGTLDLEGQLRIQDPTATGAGFGYQATLTDLRTGFTNAASDVIYDVTRNGTRTLGGSVSGLTLTSDLQVKRTFAGQPDATIGEQWTMTYTPATPIQINGQANSGALDISGTVQWVRGSEDLALVVTTPTPLQFDASCLDTVQRIKSGELRAAGTFDGADGYVRVRWNGCGKEPSFDFVPS